MIEPIKKLEDDHIQINMSSDDTIGQSRDPNLVQSITENQDSSQLLEEQLNKLNNQSNASMDDGSFEPIDYGVTRKATDVLKAFKDAEASMQSQDAMSKYSLAKKSSKKDEDEGAGLGWLALVRQ